MLRTILAATVLLGITSPALGQEASAGEETSFNGLFSDEAITRELVAARGWLETSLLDYETARFRDVRVVLLSPDRRDRSKVYLAVCGMANARNRMGGYIGFKDFYFGSHLPGYTPSAFGVMATEVCSRANRLNAVDYTDRLAPGDAAND